MRHWCSRISAVTILIWLQIENCDRCSGIRHGRTGSSDSRQSKRSASKSNQNWSDKFLVDSGEWCICGKQSERRKCTLYDYMKAINNYCAPVFFCCLRLTRFFNVSFFVAAKRWKEETNAREQKYTKKKQQSEKKIFLFFSLIFILHA